MGRMKELYEERRNAEDDYGDQPNNSPGFTEHNEAEDKISNIFEWAESHPNFDTAFVESLQSWIESGKELTPNQSSALDRIYESWKIEDWKNQ